jgi:glycosyltransferase involved in cell wall biosynthesis
MRIGLTVVDKGATPPSGVHRYAANLITGIVRAHSEHELIVFTHRNAALLRFLPNDVQRSVRFLWYRPLVDGPVSTILWHLLVLPLRTLCHRVDIVHVTNGRPVAAMGKATVLTLHDVAELDIPGKFDLLRKLYRSCLLYPYMRRQAPILTVSRQAKDDIARHLKLPPDDVIVLPNTTLGAPVQGAPPVQGPAFLYVGRIDHPSKNLPLLIKAFDQVATSMPSIELHLVGADSWRADVVHAVAEAATARTRIIFHGWVSDEELQQWYRRAHVVCLPSLHEGFGLPVIEALSAGTPVLAANSGALPEVLGTREGLLPPHDVSAWACAIQDLAANEGRRSLLLNTQRVAQKAVTLSPEEVGSNAVRVYVSLLRRRGHDRM